jgi:UDP:flavonoid glycosyltransferase YjiC (YdhE family)
MNILLAPMSNLTTSYGAMTRCLAIALKAKELGHNPIIAAGKDDVNQSLMKKYKIEIIESPVPVPFGLPKFMGKLFALLISHINFPMGKPEDTPMQSFDTVLYFMGGIQYKYFKKDVEYLRKIIMKYEISAIYGEFRLSAIVAGKQEKIKTFTSFGKPESNEWGINNRAAKGVNRYLKEQGLPLVESALDLFDWADMKIVPSIEDFERFENKKNISYVGPLLHNDYASPKNEKKYILVYLGLAVLSSKTIRKVCIEAFCNLPYEVIIGARELKEEKINNITIMKYVNFEVYFPEAICFINHAGQNSCMSGLLNAVPQINFPGFIFERRFNAKNVENCGCGIFCERSDFTPEKLREIITEIEKNSNYLINALRIKDKLLSYGGSDKVIKNMEKR